MPTYSSNDQGVHVNFQFWLFKESFLRIESSKARKGIWHLYHKVFILNSPSAEDHKTLYHSCQPSVRSYLEYATFIRVYKTLISFLQHLLNEEAEEKKKKKHSTFTCTIKWFGSIQKFTDLPKPAILQSPITSTPWSCTQHLAPLLAIPSSTTGVPLIPWEFYVSPSPSKCP